MPFTRPTLSDLITRIRADFRSRLEIEGSLLRRAMADVLAAVWAGAVHMLHGHLVHLALQLFAKTAERAFLLIIGSMYGLTPTAATFATGTVTATGVDTTVIPVGTILVRDDGVTYTTDAEATIGSEDPGEVDIAVTCETAGATGDLDVDETLVFESPIADVDSEVTVADDGSGEGLTDGTDEETTEDFRARVLLRLQEPPQGGADQDYEAWALAVAGVTRVWVYEHEDGLGTVTVRFVRDNEDPIIPSAGEVTTVQDALDDERPVTHDVTAAAPTADPIDFTFTALDPDTTAIRDAIEAELVDLFAREAEPGDGAGRGEILLSWIRTAIGVAVGDGDYTLSAPSADITPATGELPTVGDFTWP